MEEAVAEKRGSEKVADSGQEDGCPDGEDESSEHQAGVEKVEVFHGCSCVYRLRIIGWLVAGDSKLVAKKNRAGYYAGAYPPGARRETLRSAKGPVFKA